MSRLIVESHFRLDPDLKFVRPELRDLAALWERQRGSRSIPDRADFSPFELQPYLPRVLIYEVMQEDSRRRFRIRLYGTLISKYSGRDSTGKYVDEIMSPQAYEDFNRGLSWATDNRKPLRAAGSYHFVDRSFVKFESITLPLGLRGSEDVSQLLNITYYHDEA